MSQIQFHQEVEAPPIICEGFVSPTFRIVTGPKIGPRRWRKRRKSSKFLSLLIQLAGIVLGGLAGIYLGGLVVELWLKPLLLKFTT